MEALVIKETAKTPAIIFMPGGEFLLKGKSIPESVYTLYTPVFEWLKEFKAPNVTLNIDLEYINSASKVILLEIFHTIELKKSVRKITINWYFDPDDEDHYEMGLIFEEATTRIEFNYLKNHVPTDSKLPFTEINNS